MPISVNENGVVKPLGSDILYERQLRYIPWHTKYQDLIGHDCVLGNLDLFCTVDLSFVPDYVLVKRPSKVAIFSQNDSHTTDGTKNRWYFPGTASYTYTEFYEFILLTPVHSRHNMSEAEADSTLSFAYDISNVSAANYNLAYVYTGFELVDNTVKCYFRIQSSMKNTAAYVTQGIGFGYYAFEQTGADILELEVEAFGNCHSIAI